MRSAKEIARFHYLTQDDVPGYSHAQLTGIVCKAGVKWVQYRTKKLTGDALVSEARKVKTAVDEFGGILIINDHVKLAAELGTGVHLGKTDMSVREARKILGDEAIIGGTANTAGDIRRLVEEGADYIGLGPYRFTATKQNLSPVIERDELGRLLSIQADVPVIVIGGITANDIRPILDLGAHGAAVSSAINMQRDKEKQVAIFLKQFELEEV